MPDFATTLANAVSEERNRVKALILARINGEWDNPDLMEVGSLGFESDDIKRFLRVSFLTEEEKADLLLELGISSHDRNS